MTLKTTPEIQEQLVALQRERIESFKAKMDSRRKFKDKVADFLTGIFGTVIFLSLNALWFLIWILINTGNVPSVAIFDPFPFGLLTMMVSLEAIFLAIIVLISQNRSAKIDDLREEIDLQINVQAEQEITKILIMLDGIQEHLGMPPEDDAELVRMKKKTNITDIEKKLTNQMR